MYNDTYGAWTGSQTRWLNPDCYAGINMSERHQREDFSFWPGVQTSPAVDMANPVVSSASEIYPEASYQGGCYGDIIHTNTDETKAHRYEQQLFTGNFLFCGTSPSSQDFLKWKASNHHTAPDFSSISQDNMSNNVHDVLRHGSTGSAGSFRSNGGGSGVNSPTAPNNTPLVIPQPVKPATKAGKTYQCKMCDQIFHTKSDMLIHSQQIHKQDPKPYHCPQCQKCFANSSYLSQHARIHAGIKPYKCEICERKFTQLSHLQQHIRTHTGEKPYKCSHPSCGKAFSQLSNLQSHSRSHMTDKPYRCNSCYKCYADEQSLREHIPKHSDTKHLKTHICKICGKSYTQETYLARHMTKHAQDNNSTPKFPSRQIKQEPLEHSNETDFPHLNDGACTPCPPGKPSSAFMPIPQFGSATGSNNVNYPYGGGLGSNSFTTSLPQISSIAPPRYFPYDPLGFKRSEPTERNLNVSMTTRPENMLANSLLSLQHIKNYASQQMPGFGPAGSGTGASSRI